MNLLNLFKKTDYGTESVSFANLFKTTKDVSLSNGTEITLWANTELGRLWISGFQAAVVTSKHAWVHIPNHEFPEVLAFAELMQVTIESGKEHARAIEREMAQAAKAAAKAGRRIPSA